MVEGRRVNRIRIVVTALAAVALLAPGGASAQGGSSAPSPTPMEKPSAGGGAGYNGVPHPDRNRPAKPRRRANHAPKRGRRPARRRRARRRGLVLSSFSVSRPRRFLFGRPARVAFRIDGRRRETKVTISILRARDRARMATLRLGRRRIGVPQSLFLTGREAGVLPRGRYIVRISAPRLRRSASASSVRALEFFHHRHPLAGAFDYGGADARFRARRRGHRHQGQDLTAAAGTTVVAPRGGVVEAVRYQAKGGGHYVVIDGDGEDRDYVFMHLRAGSIPVRAGQRVRTGQLLGEVGSTGASSGPHLHFEIWAGGWTSGRPLDPLPLLRRFGG